MTGYIVVLIAYLFIAFAIVTLCELADKNTKWDVVPFDRGQFSIRSLLIITLVFAVCCSATPWDQVGEMELKPPPQRSTWTYHPAGGLEYQIRMNEFGHPTGEWVWED